jgi:hypothetical protein
MKKTNGSFMYTDYVGSFNSFHGSELQLLALLRSYVPCSCLSHRLAISDGRVPDSGTSANALIEIAMTFRDIGSSETLAELPLERVCQTIGVVDQDSESTSNNSHVCVVHVGCVS